MCWIFWFLYSTTWMTPGPTSVSLIPVLSLRPTRLNQACLLTSDVFYPWLQPVLDSCTLACSFCCCWVARETLACAWISPTPSMCLWTSQCSQGLTLTCLLWWDVCFVTSSETVALFIFIVFLINAVNAHSCHCVCVVGVSQDYHHRPPASPASVWLPSHYCCKWWVALSPSVWWCTDFICNYLKVAASNQKQMPLNQIKLSVVVFFIELHNHLLSVVVLLPLQCLPTWRAYPWWRPINCSTCWRPSPPAGSCSLRPRTITLYSSFSRLSTISSSTSLTVRESLCESCLFCLVVNIRVVEGTLLYVCSCSKASPLSLTSRELQPGVRHHPQT